MEIKEDLNEFNNEEINKIKEIADEIYEEMNVLDNRIIKKTFIFNIFLSLIYSIPINNIFAFYKEREKDSTGKWLQNAYDDYINIPKTGCKSSDIILRTKAKDEYYKKAFKIRAKIQNFEWTYHHLDNDVAKFIQGREIINLTKEKIINMNKKKTYCKCYNCNTKYLNNETDSCPRCAKELELNIFIKFCNTFCVLGDMYKFYKKLDTTTYKQIMENYTHVNNFFIKKRIKRNHNIWCEKRKEYGIEQYNKIIKKDKEHELDDKLKSFNRKYNTALLYDMEVLDLRNAVNANDPCFIRDLNELSFGLCTKLYLPPRNLMINDLKPNMLFLTEIHANNCGIKTIEWNPEYFKGLVMLFIENNKITEYDDIKSLIKINTLKVIALNGNPIENTRKIYSLEIEFKNYDIDIRYDTRKKYNPDKEIEMESDSEIRKIKRQNKYWLSSDSENSDDYYQKKRNQTISFK